MKAPASGGRFWVLGPRMAQPEDQARENIDRMLTKSGWTVQYPGNVHLSAHRGLAIHNFTSKQGHGFGDYLLYIDGRAAGVVETKKERVTLTGVETQSEKQQRSRFDPQDCRDSEVWQKSLLQSKMQSYEFGRGAQTARG